MRGLKNELSSPNMQQQLKCTVLARVSRPYMSGLSKILYNDIEDGLQSECGMFELHVNMRSFVPDEVVCRVPRNQVVYSDVVLLTDAVCSILSLHKDLRTQQHNNALMCFSL